MHSFGYRTGYFWEEVLQPLSFMEIIGSFMFLEKKKEKVDDGKGGLQLPHPALGRQRQDQQHFLAVASLGEPA